jgi:hypothetical protein
MAPTVTPKTTTDFADAILDRIETPSAIAQRAPADSLPAFGQCDAPLFRTRIHGPLIAFDA